MIILLIVYVVGSLFAMFRNGLFTLAGQRLVARLRTQLFSHIVKQEVAFFDTTRYIDVEMSIPVTIQQSKYSCLEFTCSNESKILNTMCGTI